jgi:hypothetical protein
MTIHDPWRGLLAHPLPKDHFVQVYRDDHVLIEALSLFAGAALGRDEAVVIVATAAHGESLQRSLAAAGYDVPTLETRGQLVVLDAEQQLPRIMVNGTPDEACFRAMVAELVARVRASDRFRAIRLYGEMVNLLWSDNLPAATRLEELWNDVLEEESISLFCSYCLDAGDRPQETLPRDLRALHTHFIPTEA